MNDVKARLGKCFQAVFPNVPEAELPSATQESVKTWDSVATITLMNLIDEEFGVQLDLEQLERFNSFESFYNHLAAAEKAR
jgi:acyl carrier protein